MTVNWQTTEVPFGTGMNTGHDRRSLPATELLRATNVEFEEEGGLQVRKPFVPLTSDAGNPAVTIRKLATYKGELLAFTDDAIYSYSPRDGQWFERADYLAPLVTERSVFIRSTEQVDCDRAELDGVVFFAWTDLAGTDVAYVAALDAETGAVILAPYALATGSVRPKLLAMDAKVLLTWYEGGATDVVFGVALNPDDVATSVAVTATSLVTAVDSDYDVTRIPGGSAVIAARQNGGADYKVAKVSEALAVSTVNPARACDGPIAVAVSPDGVHIAIVRADTTNIMGDILLASTAADVDVGNTVGTAVSTAVNQIAASFRSVQNSGVYRCYAFWSARETDDDTIFDTKVNYMTTTGAVGSEDELVRRAGVASRAFDHDGSVYVWLAFASDSGAAGMSETIGIRAALQNTYFLYRDDGTLIAKAAQFRGGGFAQSTGHLPNVQSLGSNRYAWCGVERRIIPVSDKQTEYSDRGPREIVLELDADEARRSAQFGQTLYIPGGQVVQYDGEGITELGFHVFPWFFDGIDGGAAAGAGKTGGSVSYKSTWSWPNAVGELDRSTTATGESVTVVAGNKVVIATIPLHTTLKQGDRANPAVEIWGTKTDAPVDAPFYLVTSNNPDDASNPNPYLENDPFDSFLATFDEEIADEDLNTETNPENGGILETICPPPASIIAASADRVFLAGISDAPSRIWYSKTREDGIVASFNDGLIVDVPPTGGPITALAFLHDTLIAFCETATYALGGEGFDNAGGGFNYGPARALPGGETVGALSAEVVGSTPEGILFKSRKGWHIVTRGGTVEYVGTKASAYDDETVSAVHVVETQHQVRCFGSERTLIWDYKANQWSEWSIAGVHAVVWNGQYVYVDSGASFGDVWVQGDWGDSGAETVSADVELNLNYSGVTAYQAVKAFSLVGAYQSACRIRWRVAYNGSESYTDDVYRTPTAVVAGNPIHCQMGPSRKKASQFRVRITSEHASTDDAAPSGEGFKLTALGVEVGRLRGLWKGLPASQKGG